MNRQSAIYTSIATVPIILVFVIILSTGLGKVDTTITLFSIGFYIILTPVVEELLFRDILQANIYNRLTSKRILIFTYANIITSIIFAFMHIFNGSLLHSSLVFFPSIIFGLLYDKTGSVMPSIITHSVYNFNILILYNDKVLNFFSVI